MYCSCGECCVTRQDKKKRERPKEGRKVRRQLHTNRIDFLTRQGDVLDGRKETKPRRASFTKAHNACTGRQHKDHYIVCFEENRTKTKNMKKKTKKRRRPCMHETTRAIPTNSNSSTAERTNERTHCVHSFANQPCLATRAHARQERPVGLCKCRLLLLCIVTCCRCVANKPSTSRI